MNWGTELWDQYDNLSAHTQKGIEFLDKYGNFVKERCAIELEYAGKLRRLVKNYQPKRKEEDEYQYTSCKAFRQLLQELGDFAGQREVVAENLQSNVVRELHLLAKELREERKQHLNEGAKQMAVLNSAIGSLDRARRAYERAARESERALEAFQRADADLNLSRAEVEKQKANMKLRSQACEDAKHEYADQLRKTNEAQRQHYEQRLPHVFKQLQDLDEKRIKHIKNFMLSSVEVERKVFPIIKQCLDGMEHAANSINEKEDTQLVIDRYKSGFVPPEDFPFEEQRAGADTTDAATTHNHHAQLTVRGTVSGNRIKKRGGLLSIFSSNKIVEACNSFKNNMSTDGKEDYSDLPPNQKKKKLQAKVHELNKQVAQEQAAMEGLMKMKGVYETNPTLGDPMTVEGQLNECCDKLKKLRAQLRKFEELLAEANSQVCAAPLNPTARPTAPRPRRNIPPVSVQTAAPCPGRRQSPQCRRGRARARAAGPCAARAAARPAARPSPAWAASWQRRTLSPTVTMTTTTSPTSTTTTNRTYSRWGTAKRSIRLKQTARGRRCAWSAASGCSCWRRTRATAGRACAASSRARRASCPPPTSPPRSTRTRRTSPHTPNEMQCKATRRSGSAAARAPRDKPPVA
ncbi:formin-binding protein 1-like isoform X2 [Leguminivora glycinivorella]|uniref:formin-binding protein 1-like isoform X2 n=1 Tax=Leguminivora glycinivorella TaxID=1035111 RepID=UPI00200D820A|nr:formin-binding protein 1-like isoform X2 [Leguminivora glycinivorella]